MDTSFIPEAWHSAGIPLVTFIYCFVSALVPFVNAEAYLLLISVMNINHFAIIFPAALGQMLGKTVMYYLGRMAGNLVPEKYNVPIEKARTKLKTWKYGIPAFVFISASTGFPPFYAVSILCGTLRSSFIGFFSSGIVGRLVRFGLIVFAPLLIKGLF